MNLTFITKSLTFLAIQTHQNSSYQHVIKSIFLMFNEISSLFLLFGILSNTSVCVSTRFFIAYCI